MLLLVCVMGLFVILGAWLFSNESAEFAIASAPAAAAPAVRDEPPPSAPAASVEAARAPETEASEPAAPAERLRGLTKFQRRLAAGERLQTIREELEASAVDVETAARRVRALVPALLRADGYGRRSVRIRRKTSRGEVVQVLEWLTKPSRDPRALKLAGQESADPLLDRRTVRAWTLGGSLSDKEVASATHLIDHIAAVIGTPIDKGFDVLVTPGQGRDVFPRLWMYPWSVGVYYPRDDFATVRSTLPRDVRGEVLQHELIHAYEQRFLKLRSRLVSEGLAEYLRLVEPGDDGFNVPPERMRDNFAALLKRLEFLKACGFDMTAVKPALLVKVDPVHFYELRWISYLMAQASLAYVGDDVIRQSLLEGSDAGIVRAIREMRWQSFLAFVRRHGARGSSARSMVVRDYTPGPVGAGRVDAEAFTRALESIGVEVPRDVKIDPQSLYVGRLSARERVLSVLRSFSDGSVTPLFYSDRSAAMDVEVRFEPMDPELQEALGEKRITAATGREFADGLFRELSYRAPPSRSVRFHRVIHAHFRSAISGRLLQFPYDPLRLPQRLAALDRLLAKHPQTGIVLSVASEWSPPEGYNALETLSKARALPAAVLVVDLSDGSGDALRLAKLMDAAQGGFGAVAYWNPRKPLPR